MTAGSPFVSVVIPTFNRCEQLKRLLVALAQQDYSAPDVQIVVVSDGATDGTNDYLRSADVPVPITAVEQANAGPAAARNAGLRAATGELVVFLDDDIVPDRSLISEHVRAHRSGTDKTVAIGPMLTPSDVRLAAWVAWEQHMLERQYTAMEQGVYEATARQFYTGNASLRREAALRAGGFDATFKRAEDIEFAYRLADEGFRFTFVPTARGYHYAERSFEAWLAIASAYGTTDVVLGRDHGREWLLTSVRDKFRGQLPPVRWLQHACIRSDAVRRASAWTIERAFRLVQRRDRSRIRRLALSGLYALSYFGGVASALGCADEFRDFVR
jgi:GT2 family glycosyltransferase